MSRCVVITSTDVADIREHAAGIGLAQNQRRKFHGDRVAVNVTWSPCPDATASMQFVGMVHHEAALVLSQGDGRVILVPPRDRANWARFCQLLHEIRDSADELATFLDLAIPETAKGVGRP